MIKVLALSIVVTSLLAAQRVSAPVIDISNNATGYNFRFMATGVPTHNNSDPWDFSGTSKGVFTPDMSLHFVGNYKTPPPSTLQFFQYSKDAYPYWYVDPSNLHKYIWFEGKLYDTDWDYQSTLLSRQDWQSIPITN